VDSHASGGVRAARPWLAAWAGGLAGTAVMTVALAAETKLRPDSDGPVDYDASDHVVIAACKILRRPVPRSAAGRRAIFNVVHWGYGSAVAMEFEAVRRHTPSEPVATGVFYLACQTMAFSLFPTLGETPPPWRWQRELLASSMGVHALYAITVTVVARRLRA
jgi:hypothetical protein